MELWIILVRKCFKGQDMIVEVNFFFKNKFFYYFKSIVILKLMFGVLEYFVTNYAAVSLHLKPLQHKKFNKELALLIYKFLIILLNL